MKKLALGIIIGGISVFGVTSALSAYDSQQHIVLVRHSDDGFIDKYYDYDSGVTCYSLWHNGVAISCVQISAK